MEHHDYASEVLGCPECKGTGDTGIPVGAMVELLRYNGYEVQKIEECDHEWVDARNTFISSGEMCLKCSALRAGNQTSEVTPSEAVEGGESELRISKCDACGGTSLVFECDHEWVMDVRNEDLSVNEFCRKCLTVKVELGRGGNQISEDSHR